MNKNAKTSNQLLLIQNMFLIVLFFCGLFCASHTNTIRAKRQIPNDGNFTGDKLKDWQVADQTTCEENTVLLVQIFQSLRTSLTESIEFNEQELTDIFRSEIKEVWQCLVANHKGLANSGESPESLRAYMAKILFDTNERHCESPDETFFNGQCLPVSTENWSEHCPENMVLYDGPDNEGICDCLELSGEKAKFELRLIFSNLTERCYPQNTQGPCEDGQWFIRKKAAQCETVPEGCPTDGHHVHWSPDETSVPKQCWKIGTEGPCEDGKIIHLIWLQQTNKKLISEHRACSDQSAPSHSTPEHTNRRVSKHRHSVRMNLFLLTETEREFSRTGFLKVEMDKIFTGKITMAKTLDAVNTSE